MALQDILDCLSAHADARITEYRKAHQCRISDMREATERKMSGLKQTIHAQKEKRFKELIRKSEAHASGIKKNIILRKKQDLLSALFSETLRYLESLPPEHVLPFLKSCLAHLQNEKGVVRPAPPHAALLKSILPSSCAFGDPIDAHGGFLFVSPLCEKNFTFDHILLSTLRPTLEVDMALSLFRL